MSPIVTAILPALLLVAAVVIGRRELALYRGRGQHENDVFVYTRGRLVRRITGTVILGMMALTFLALGLWPPRNGSELSTYVGLLVAELGSLLLIPIWDLVETARTARPGAGLTFQDEARQTAMRLRELADKKKREAAGAARTDGDPQL